MVASRGDRGAQVLYLCRGNPTGHQFRASAATSSPSAAGGVRPCRRTIRCSSIRHCCTPRSQTRLLLRSHGSGVGGLLCVVQSTMIFRALVSHVFPPASQSWRGQGPAEHALKPDGAVPNAICFICVFRTQVSPSLLSLFSPRLPVPPSRLCGDLWSSTPQCSAQCFVSVSWL